MTKVALPMHWLRVYYRDKDIDFTKLVIAFQWLLLFYLLFCCYKLEDRTDTLKGMIEKDRVLQMALVKDLVKLEVLK